MACRALGGHVLAASLAGLTLGCAPAQELPPLPIEVCGEDAPVQILALGDDEAVDWEGIAQFEDRWLFGVRRFEIPLTSLRSIRAAPEDRAFAQLDARLESVGQCGEDRQVVAEDVDFVIPAQQDGDAWLGCRTDTGDFYWIAPDGAWAARPVARAASCRQFVVRGHDVFFIAAETHEYTRAQLRDDGIVLDVLVTDVVKQSPDYTTIDGESLPAPDVYLLRETDRVLVRLELATGMVEDVLDGVDDFSVAADRQRVMRIRRIPQDPNDSTTPNATVLDLGSNSESWFSGVGWSDIRGFLADGYVFVQGLDPNGLPLQTVVVTVPALHLRFLDGPVFVRGSDGDDRVVISASPDGLEVLEMSSGDRHPVQTSVAIVSDGILWYEDERPYGHVDLPDEYRPVDVIRMPLATLEPEVVHKRVFSSIEVADDLWLDNSPIDDNELTELVVVDGESLTIRRVDRNVVQGLYFVEPAPDRDPLAPSSSNDLVYQVHERATDRGGMWRVRFEQ
ncbi:MAG TPA: hypothetical protein VFG69_17895 [Nannocystaceae bacterium]|nr:hypothetical protein [Nannocystaceae bacterium]